MPLTIFFAHTYAIRTISHKERLSTISLIAYGVSILQLIKHFSSENGVSALLMKEFISSNLVSTFAPLTPFPTSLSP